MPLLPIIRTPEEHRASPRDEATYLPAVREICRRNGLPAERCAKYAGGSTIVFAIGADHVVKLFEPIFPGEAATERAVLERVEGRLAVPTPRVVAAGEMEGWSYVVMSQLAGRSLREAWDEIATAERAEICRRVGEAVARLHALPAETLPIPGPGWEEFLARQAEGCVERQRKYGLAEGWLEQVPGYLASVLLPPRRPVLLHTEVMRDHVLVQRGAAGWEVTGIFDFEPAMRGDPEYELASVGIFLAGGDPALFGAFLRGYGLPAEALDAELRRRVLAYTLLHRYSRMSWYLDVVPPRAAATLDELAAEWFAFE